MARRDEAKLTPRSVHLCIDMQRLFSEEGPWPTPWMKRVLPQAEALAARFPERTIFTRFIPPARPTDMFGAWRSYYERWREVTQENLDPRLLELMPTLAALTPRSGHRQACLFSFQWASPASGIDPAAGRDINSLRCRNRCLCAGDHSWGDRSWLCGGDCGRRRLQFIRSRARQSALSFRTEIQPICRDDGHPRYPFGMAGALVAGLRHNDDLAAAALVVTEFGPRPSNAGGRIMREAQRPRRGGKGCVQRRGLCDVVCG